MALGNLGFEDAGASSGDADLWTVVLTIQGERMALFGTGSDVTETEGFELEWDAAYLFAFSVLDVTPPLFDDDISEGEGLEDFEEGWSDNHFDGEGLSAIDAGDLDTFETTWSGNEDDLEAFAGADLHSGYSDTFESGWNANETDELVHSSVTAAEFDSAAFGEDVEDFEETYTDKLVGTVDPATNVITVPSLHGFGVGDRVQFRLVGAGALPAGLNASFLYWVRSGSLTTTDFTIAVASGGAAVDITDAGVGTIYIRGNPERYWRLDA